MTLLRCTDLVKTYLLGKLQLDVLHGLNLQVDKGEYVAIMGPSGSGKSTLMNILGCLDTPTSGSYILDGEPVAGMTDAELADIRNRKIGFVFQTFNLLPRQSARANVELPLIYAGIPAARRHELSLKVLEEVGLAERAHHKPNELSGGERQRVAVARALINRPSLLLADEPTGNLDTKTGIEIMELFERLHDEGNTIVLVTHEDEIGARAKRIVRLRDGRIESDQKTGSTSGAGVS
jgi:putative ABC transport system ATP-binding protein